MAGRRKRVGAFLNPEQAHRCVLPARFRCLKRVEAAITLWRPESGALRQVLAARRSLPHPQYRYCDNGAQLGDAYGAPTQRRNCQPNGAHQSAGYNPQ